MMSTTGCGFGGWLMTGAGFLLLAVLFLTAAALVKYLFVGGRGGHGRREP